jgi:large subunit ribosomal protein L34e
MPRPQNRTRSKKRVSKALPGGGHTTTYKQKAVGAACCSICGRPLAGTEHLSKLKASKLNRSKKRVWRPYGGQLCHNCLQTSLRQAARKT